jgi:nitrite reductase/ring-hydroxylating ferredoxin subunit
VPVSPALAFIGISILGTWGIASIGLIAGGIIIWAFPGNAATASGGALPGLVLIIAGLISTGVMLQVSMPLLGIDPPFPIPAKKRVPVAKLTRWTKAGLLRDFPDGKPKEIRLLSKRIAIIRMGDTAYAMNALCSHARLPIAGLPGLPIRAEPIRDGCAMCPFHGARFEIETGRVVRQPFDSQFNNEHPFLGKLQMGLFKVLSKPPVPNALKYFKPSMSAEEIQTFPVRIENGEVVVGLPQKLP